MDDLRPDHVDDGDLVDEVEYDDPTPPIDAGVAARLAAYGHADAEPADVAFQPTALGNERSVDESESDHAPPVAPSHEHLQPDPAVDEELRQPTMSMHEPSVFEGTAVAAVATAGHVDGESANAGDEGVSDPTEPLGLPTVPENDGALSVDEVGSPKRRRSLGLKRGRSTEHTSAHEKKAKRAKKLVGLKIGASQIAAAQVVNNGAPEVVEVVREPLEPGVVVFGEIRDPETLGDALKRFFDLHKLPRRGVRLGISNNRMGVRIFEIEGVADDQQLENAIRFRAEDVLPIPLDETVHDYVVLDERANDDGTATKRVLLVVAYREVVDRYVQACRRAGVQLEGIDLEAFALLRSLDAPTERGQTSGALVGVAIGHDRTTIAVSTGLYCEFARVVDWGGWSLNVAIARELDRAPSEVESIKRQVSFAHRTEIDGLTAEQVAKTREAARRALDAFARELVSSLQFYQAQPGALGIGEIVVTGGTAHMDGLPEAVSQLIGVPIRLGDPFKRVKVGPKVALDDQFGSLAIAIGLGIED
jgi:type IV pilus assembly protein PilM